MGRQQLTHHTRNIYDGWDIEYEWAGLGRANVAWDYLLVFGEAASMKEGGVKMELGAFSVSLNVADLLASKEFYEKLGFSPFAGDPAQNWLIMKNGSHVIGLFHGMFERNILTFNPGWDQNAQPLDSFMDVRELQKQLKAAGLTILDEVDEDTIGPGSFVVVDPDGNPILIDQHVGHITSDHL